VEIGADITSGLPGVYLVGLPDAALQESRDRVRARGHQLRQQPARGPADADAVAGDAAEGGIALRHVKDANDTVLTSFGLRIARRPPRSRGFRSTRLHGFAGRLQRRRLPAAVVAVGAESPAAAAHRRPAAGHRCSPYRQRWCTR